MIRIVLLSLCLLALVGCSSVNQVNLNKKSITAEATTASVIRNDDGSGVSQASQAVSQLKTANTTLTTAGTGSMFTIEKDGIIIRAWLPKDAKIGTLEFSKAEDGTPELKINNLEVTGSTVISAATEQILKALETQGNLTEAEAAARAAAAQQLFDAAKDALDKLK